MKNVLFLVRSFSKGGPQPIRFQNIITFLKDDYIIHVIESHHSKKETVKEKGVVLHKLQYTKIGKKLNVDIPKGNNIKGSIGKNNFSIIRYLKSFLKKFIFPDTYITEICRIKKSMLSIIYANSIDVVVISAFPFSTLSVARVVKLKNPRIKIIYDIGDPFIDYSNWGFARNFLAKIYESFYLSYIDYLVVTNNVTKTFYQKRHKKILSSNKVIVIEQGVNDEFLNTSTTIRVNKDNINLIYAGRFYKKLREPYELYKAINEINKINTFQTILDIYGNYDSRFLSPKYLNKSITFKGTISNIEVYEKYKSADIIVLIDNSFGMQTPGKLFEVAAFGKPVLFIYENASSPAYAVVRDLTHFFICRNNNQEILNAVLKIKESIKEMVVDVNLIQYSWCNKALSYAKIITDK